MDLSWNDFTKVDMRVGTVVKVEDFPQARNPAYKLWIDFGALGTLKSSAQITVKYNKEELLGAQVVAAVNFPEKQIGPLMSQCLVLGAVDGKAVTLLSPNKEVPNGLRIA